MRIRAKLLERAKQLLDRLDAEHLELKVVSDGRNEGSHVERVVVPRPSGAVARDLAVAVGILIDKYRLEMGEDTDRRRVTQDVTLSRLTDEDLDRELIELLTALLLPCRLPVDLLSPKWGRSLIPRPRDCAGRGRRR
jgi:hypothetical protein